MSETSIFDVRTGHSGHLLRKAKALGLWLCVSAGVVPFAQGCSEAWHASVPLDCSQEDSYDKIETYEPGQMEVRSTGLTWDGYGDTTPGGSWTGQDASPAAPPTLPIENGGRCGSTTSLVLEASGFHDYGSGFNDYNPGGLQMPCLAADGTSLTCPMDASGYQGVAFWARSPGATTKSVTLTITDGDSLADSITTKTTCTYYATEAGTGGVTTYTTTSNTNSGTGNANVATGSSVAAAQPPANACGNNFAYELVTSDDWELYRIPFTAFAQAFQPDRTPRGFDPSTFFTVNVIVPKEAELQLWIDDFGFYPAKHDGGAL